VSAGPPAVTGIGLVTPIGADPGAFWSALVEGRNGAAGVRSFDTAGLPHRVGCEVRSFDLPPAARRRILGGRCTELAAAAALQAVEGAGLAAAIRGTRDTAVVVGTTMGEVTQFEQDRAAHADREPSPEDVHSLAHRPPDVIGRSIARIFDLGGPLLTVPAACAAGAYAIGIAASIVARGEAVRALAIGCEAFSRLAFVGFSRMRAMSPDLCRPFSLGRPGLLLGEGAGALVIESAERARSRGAEVLAHVEGFGLSCDAFHVTGPDPRGAGALRAMRQALARAGVSPAAVDYVNAHGTGTPLNDRMESLALRELFGADLDGVPVSSIKALTGHMMGAAGAVEAIASLLALRHGTAPPTWNFVERDPDCDVDCVPNRPRPMRIGRVLSNSYAFGGNNASLVLAAPGAERGGR
jgi:3-oxoacyl-[acyl-carrier-protein] synthase II